MIWEGELPKGYWINHCKLSVPYINGAVESHEICVLTPIQTIFLFISCRSVFNGAVFKRNIQWKSPICHKSLTVYCIMWYNDRESNTPF